MRRSRERRQSGRWRRARSTLRQWAHARAPMSSAKEVGRRRSLDTESSSPMSAAEPRRDRFLTPAMAATLAVYGIVAASFARFQIKNDGASYFNMMQRFFGEHPDSAFAYQFGSDVWNA